RRLVAGGATLVALYALAILLVARLGRSGASICAEMAARVHDAISAERAVDLTPPPPPPSVEPPAARVVDPAFRQRVHVASARRAASAPAQAGRLAATSESPVDLTGSAFVVGSGSTYAGGTTTSGGTSQRAVTGPVVPGGAGTTARSRARPVTLDAGSWSCPWPAEADARQVDQETVVIRVAVGADGRADRVDVLEDPGFGFGAAARQCALVTRFGAARDAAGEPVGALSPPIRVHFHR
ncbi:MAG TPA: ferric siderophore ABC transporter substrate-binding protein, partial [Polyangia bacterium]|nr:ferric siderophore ABC transporter substrate-binding protein [Polyangia bacterium]